MNEEIKRTWGNALLVVGFGLFVVAAPLVIVDTQRELPVSLLGMVALLLVIVGAWLRPSRYRY